MRAWTAWMLVALFFAAGPAPKVSAGDAKEARVEVRVEGLACPFCAYGMEKKLKELKGLENVEILVDDGRAILSFDRSGDVDFGAIEAAIRKGGFTPRAIQATLAGTIVRSGGRVFLQPDGSERTILLTGSTALESWLQHAGRNARLLVTGFIRKIEPEKSGGAAYVMDVERFVRTDAPSVS